MCYIIIIIIIIIITTIIIIFIIIIITTIIIVIGLNPDRRPSEQSEFSVSQISPDSSEDEWKYSHKKGRDRKDSEGETICFLLLSSPSLSL
jgi:hypothetical protein